MDAVTSLSYPSIYGVLAYSKERNNTERYGRFYRSDGIGYLPPFTGIGLFTDRRG